MIASLPCPGALDGIKVLDLSRVLAGPWCTQILGDLGAEVIKIEQPGAGDDTRHWGPPFIDDGSHDSSYYSCANRNKRSLAVDITAPKGADLIRRLAAQSDIVVDNFRVGGLAKYGLDYASLSRIKADLIVCSITGFGQDGPDKDRGGYDFLIQGMSGLMSVTGIADGEPGGGPMKVGIPISDLATALYSTVSILAALNHRNNTGEGQFIDMALLDTQIALMSNQAANWLNGRKEPRRLGNQHPNMVPYQVFSCSDGDVLVAIGNNRQFSKFCEILNCAELVSDPLYATVSARNVNRNTLLTRLADQLIEWSSDELIDALSAAKVPVGEINTVPQALEYPQVKARGLAKTIRRSNGGAIAFLGYPGKFSRTPASYRHAPPRMGEDSRAILRERLELSDDEIENLLAAGIITDCE